MVEAFSVVCWTYSTEFTRILLLQYGQSPNWRNQAFHGDQSPVQTTSCGDFE